MFETVVVLGSDGFVGRHLVAEFQRAGAVTMGVDRRSFSTDAACAAELAARIAGPRRPALVVHAAGLVGLHDEAALRTAHLESTATLLDAVARSAPGARVVVVGSAAELGFGGADETVVVERETGRPSNPYGASKLEQSATARRIALERNLDLVRVRLFNTLGPNQSTALVGGAMVDRLYTASKAGASEFAVRDPLSVRDYMDVRDVASAIRAVSERLPRDPGRAPVNVCSGVGTTVAALAGELLAVSGVNIALRFERQTAGATRVVGDASTLRRLVGDAGAPRTETRTSLADMWNARVRDDGPTERKA